VNNKLLHVWDEPAVSCINLLYRHVKR